MSVAAIGILGVLGLLLLIFARVPIAIALAVSGLAGYAALDVPGKKLLMDGGGEAIKLSAADSAKIRAVGAEVAETTIKGYEAKGLPARAVVDMMRSLSDRHAKTSKNFWN